MNDQTPATMPIHELLRTLARETRARQAAEARAAVAEQRRLAEAVDRRVGALDEQLFLASRAAEAAKASEKEAWSKEVDARARAMGAELQRDRLKVRLVEAENEVERLRAESERRLSALRVLVRGCEAWGREGDGVPDDGPVGAAYDAALVEIGEAGRP